MQFFKIASLIPALLLLSSCASRVSSIQDLDEYKEKGIGYAAFSFALEDDARVELEVKNTDIDKSFVFYLNEQPSSLNLYLGPFIVYRKYIEEKKASPLTMIPLPVGNYVCNYIRVKRGKDKNAWKSSRETFRIQKEKATYIGSYNAQIKWLLTIPTGLVVDVKDDLESRVKEMGIEGSVEKKICQIKN